MTFRAPLPGARSASPFLRWFGHRSRNGSCTRRTLLKCRIDSLAGKGQHHETFEEAHAQARQGRRQAAQGLHGRGTDGDARARQGDEGGKADGESDLLAKIAALPQPDRAWPSGSTRSSRPTRRRSRRRPGTGCPAYARDDKVVCFFQSAHKFKTRYATFGFSDKAKLDDGEMWPTAFALKSLGAAEEAKIVALLKKAVR
jgi:hypothetical protein